MLMMANPSDPATHQIKEKLRHLYDAVHEIETQRISNKETLDKIKKIHDKVSDVRISAYYQQKLKNLYTAAIDEGNEESNQLREALDTINEIREIVHEHRIQSRNIGNKDTFRRGAHMKMLQIYAQTLPLWIGEDELESPPPLCAAIPAESHYIAKPGDMVAALVKGIEDEENWILAEIVSWNTVSGKYEVDDIDEGQKERYLLSRRKVIPLPLMKANPDTEPEALFPKDSIVLALYPQTTCFYKAIVSSLPTTAAGEYEVLFEDSSYPSGYAPPLNVAQRYVISYKEIKKKNTQIM